MDEQILAHSGHYLRPDIQEEKTPHACYDGWVFLGIEGEDEHGEPIEVIERVPCRRCRPSSL